MRFTRQSGADVPLAQPAFVELISTVPAGLGECKVEWERPREALMRLHLNARWPQVGTLARLFLGASA